MKTKDWKTAEKNHNALWVDVLSLHKKKRSGYVLFYSDRISDILCNYAGQINLTAKNVPKAINDVVMFYRKVNRKPCFVITSWTRPHNLSAILVNMGWKSESNVAWMTLIKNKIRVTKNPNLNIKLVDSEKEMKVAKRVFNYSYGGKRTKDTPYGGLSPIYGEKLLDSYLKSEHKRSKTIFFYLAYLNNQPAGIAMLVMLKNYTAIYSVGVIPSFRKQGIGTALLADCVNAAMENGRKDIFLQTEANSYNEKLYKKMGFSTVFVTKEYILK